MTPPPVSRLGRLQLQILQILWARGQASVAEVHSALNPKNDLAYTTVATMLRKMEQRNLVEHHSEGRVFIYRALVAETEVAQGLADDLVERIFGGSLSDMVAHLLDTRNVSAAELRKIEALVAQHKRSK